MTACVGACVGTCLDLCVGTSLCGCFRLRVGACAFVWFVCVYVRVESYEGACVCGRISVWVRACVGECEWMLVCGCMCVEESVSV